MLWRKTSKRRAPPPGFIEPCIPTVFARRGETVRLLTRNGFDWTKRYPLIAAAVPRLPVKSATIDGEAVLLGEDGIADFRKLHSRTDDGQVMLYAFDLLELDGQDLRKEPLDRRRERLRTLLEGASDISFSEHFEGDGAQLFAHACKFGLEGIVSKRRDKPYQSGPSKSWLKIKNPQSPAMMRLRSIKAEAGHVVADGFCGRSSGAHQRG
jgi:bifunctional non-homologous end joining protein LigD